MATRTPSIKTVSARVSMAEYGKINIIAGNNEVTVSELIKQKLLSEIDTNEVLQKFWHAIDIAVLEDNVSDKQKVKNLIEFMDNCLGKTPEEMDLFCDDYINSNTHRIPESAMAQYGMYIKK